MGKQIAAAPEYFELKFLDLFYNCDKDLEKFMLLLIKLKLQNFQQFLEILSDYHIQMYCEL